MCEMKLIIYIKGKVAFRLNVVANVLVYVEKGKTLIPEITIHAYKAVSITSTWIIICNNEETAQR